MKRLDQLTFTRFWALLLVLIYHGGGGIYTGWISYPPLLSILYSAPTAVSYLYVLSGFVMSLVYYRPAEKFELHAYWTTRFVRIYPLYILSFVLTCYYYLDYIARINPQKVLVNIFVLQAWWPPYAQSFNYASWSMTVEFFFYAVFPFFTMWAFRQSTAKLIWSSLALWLITQFAHFTLWTANNPRWESLIVYNPIFHLSSFILGAVGGIWYLRNVKGQAVTQLQNLCVMAGSLVLISGYTILSNIHPQLPHNLQPMSGLLSPFFILFIVSLALDRTVISALLTKRWPVLLGETAFALYILHVPVIWIYERTLFSSGLIDPQHVLDITYLPLMIIMGLVACLYVDPPMRKFLKSVLNRISIRLALLDLLVVAISVYLAYLVRFGSGREFMKYETAVLLMFWSAFLVRTAVTLTVNEIRPLYDLQPIRQWARSLLISTSAGTVVLVAVMFAAHSVGWITNFPRSVFLIEWLSVFSLSLLVRYLFPSWGRGWAPRRLPA